ncbi:MAG: hypothetical protein GXO77_10490 [Calditrichaeota bacterium]|nr:hypothetical protein [Calditrichota bacterium]
MYRLLFTIFLPFILLAQNHLLITEVFIPPTAESQKTFIEITNTTSQAAELDSLYLANYNTYYKVVKNEFPSASRFFVARFPQTVLQPGEVVVVALDGNGYFEAFGKHADFELKSTDDQAQDMDVIKMGINPSLETIKGMMALFYWDGQQDLVKDVDYIPWGLIAFNSVWMDKSGLQIDGPDADTTESSYFDDLPTAQQKTWSNIPSGQSLQRKSAEETDELTSGGNGVTGHNEATENWQQSFKTADPTPGSFSLIAGDGTGVAVLDPDTVNTNVIFNAAVTIGTEDEYELTSVQITVPSEITWSQQANDVSLEGTGFSGASFTVNQNQITIQNAQINKQQSGQIILKNLTAPDQEGKYGFQVLTATQNGELTPISVFPLLAVLKKLTIADIQNNTAEFEGKTVTIEAVVTIGVNVTRSDRTDAYVQDESGRGINLSDFSTDYPELQRGNRLKITGTVTNYISTSGDETTEIVDFKLTLLSENNEIPSVSYLTCAEASNIELEGTFIETAGIITDKAENIGGGTNITLDDGTGILQLRIWDSSGLDLSAFSVGDTVTARGVIGSYRKAAQMVVAYQQDIFKSSLPKSIAGSGKITVQPDSVGKNETVTLTFTLKGTLADTLGQFALTIPDDWQWDGNETNVQLSGEFGDASLNIDGKTISLSDFIITDISEGEITVSGLQSPDKDTSSVFTVKTGAVSGLLKAVVSPPIVMVGKGSNRPYISIKEARAKGVGKSVTVRGVITIGTGILRTNFTDAYIQDESGSGINIYQPGGLDSRLKRGRLVILSGELDEYQGKKEIVNYQVTVLRDGVEIPAVKKISTYEASTLQHEGSFVEIEGLISGKRYSGGGTTIYMNDGSGEVAVRVWDAAGLDLTEFEMGDYVSVRGVVGIYQGSGQILLGYQEDIQRPQIPESKVYLKVPNKPFVPDEGEILPVEFHSGSSNTHVTLRIFDLSGRLVTTLFDGGGLPFPVSYSWDGRDQLGELLPLGTYLCHLEVVNNTNGKRTVKIAPIVVGTVLK